MATPLQATPPTAVNLMLDAAEMLEAAAARLDRTEHTCDKCSRKTHHNWTHANIAKQLDAMVHKLGRLADELVRKGEDT